MKGKKASKPETAKDRCAKCRGTNEAEVGSTICTPCNRRQMQKQKRKAARELLYLGVAFLVGGSIFNTQPQWPEYAFAYFCLMGFLTAGMVAGWRFLSQKVKVTSRKRGEATYFIGGKLVLSALVGLCLLPLLIFNNIRCLLLTSKLERKLG